VQPLTPQLAAEVEAPNSVHGLVISRVDPSGPASRLLTKGDVIVSVIGRGGVQRAVLSGDQLKDAISNTGNGVVSLLVYNKQAGGTRVVNVPLNQ
jgi:S1-C subfamily serine protease